MSQPNRQPPATPKSPLSASDYATLDTRDMPAAIAYRLLTGVVVPRPIAWISTCNAQGSTVNLAPFSSFNYVAHDPPMLAVNINRNEDGSLKDSARNIEATQEFVVNMPAVDAVDVLNASSQPWPSDVSEADALGIALLPSVRVAPPRIALSHAQMECRLRHRLELGRSSTSPGSNIPGANIPGANILYIGEVMAFHLAHTLFDGQRVNGQALNPLSRLGGPFYGTVGRAWMAQA